ncbi:hypothetical protein B9Z19DRAFT_1068081 [Tuber borchii]|uniref:Uncharacterized protein n=1 Tax=Tuber borchii TaxID=42251 RepID=A0A2T6ZGI9_TUBBO|nr:hypothetical protein B9Z19DRAFT_1068081 [Tuber borchii]
MSGNKRNKMSSGPIGPILDIAPTTNPGPKRARVGAKTEGSNLISTPSERRAALQASTPEIDASGGSPTQQLDPGPSPHSVIGSILSETTYPPCFPLAEKVEQTSGLSNPQASPEHIYRGQSNYNLPRSPPSEFEADKNFFEEIYSGQNAPMPPCQSAGSLHPGAQRTLCHSPDESNVHSSYDYKQNSLSPLYPSVGVPANFVNRPSGVPLEVPAAQLSQLGLSTDSGRPEVKNQELSGSTQLGVPSGASIHLGQSAPISSDSALMLHHSEETSNRAVRTCEQAAPEITYQKNPISLLLQPFHGTPIEAPDDLVSTSAFTSTGSNQSPGVFLQNLMEDIPSEAYHFEGEWLNPSPSAVLGFDSLAKDSPPMPFCHGIPFPGSVSLDSQGWGKRAEAHLAEKATLGSQSTPYSNLSSIISPRGEYSSSEFSVLTGQAWAPISMKGLEDYGGPSNEGEGQVMRPSNSYAGVFANCSTEHGTVYSTPALKRCEWLNISGLGGEGDGKEVYGDLPYNWGEASVFSSPLEALNKPVDEELLGRNEVAHKHSKDLHRPLDIPPCKASNATPVIDQSWRKIKLPLVTFRGPWQDIPNPDEDAMGGKYYGEILYSWASPEHKPNHPGPASLTACSLPTSNSKSTIPKGKKQAVKPLSIIERRMARQRAGVRKSSRAKNPPPKK